jgi:putative DNA primase/helicase
VKKQALTKFDETYDNPDNLENAGLLLNDQIVVVDFDNDNATEREIIEYLGTMYPTQIVKTDRGVHFYYSKPNGLKIKNWSDRVTVGGFQIDYKTGSTSYMVVKLRGKLRQCNQTLTLDNLPPLPQILYPLRKAENITGLSEGDGRNNSLFKHLMLIKEQYSEIDVTDISNVINNITFSDSLDDRELEALIKSVANRESKSFSSENNDIADFAIFLVKELDIKRYSKQTYIKYGLSYSSDEELLQREANKYKKLKLNQFTELKHQLITYAEPIDEDAIFKVKVRNGYIEDDRVINCEDDFTPFYLDIEYDVNAYDEDVDKFLNFLCCGREDMRKVIEEIIGHVLMTSKYPAHLFFLTGNGQNGKSTFASMLGNFAGNLASYIDISKFSDGTCLLEIKDKLINVAEDIDSTYISKAKYLKTFASGETISERAIYNKPVKMRNTATMIFTTNEVPDFKDKTGGTRRRILIIPFDNEVKEKNPKMINLLSTQSAKSYILKLGLQGIGRIIENGYKLSHSQTIEDATKQYYVDNDSVVNYINEHPNIHNKTTNDVYSSYVDFCEESEIYPVKIGTFSKRLNALGYSVSNTTLMGKKVRIYVKRIH